MGNTAPGFLEEGCDQSSIIDPQKPHLPQQDSPNDDGDDDHSSFLVPQSQLFSKPRRVVRHVTHTTNATYDDAASLSTCATNSVFVSKVPSHETTHSDSIEGQLHAKMQMQPPQKQTRSGKRLSKYKDPNQNEKQVVGVMYTSSTTVTSSSSSLSPTPSATSQHHHQSTFSTILGKSNSTVNHHNHNHLTNNHKNKTKAQDQWQSAWEEDDESSDDSDDGDHDNNTENHARKPTSRRIKSDSILSRKLQEAIRQEVNATCRNEQYEKPNIMMFFPLLRVLGKGSFGKVCTHL